MQALINQCGLIKNMIGNKIMTFGASGVFVFQGIKLRVIKQIPYGWVPNSMGFHCMVHKTNIVI